MSIHVVGIGLDGATGLKESVRQIVGWATVLVGSDRHLSYFPESSAHRLVLGDFIEVTQQIQQILATWEIRQQRIRQGLIADDTMVEPLIVVLVSGDPLFFGLGRLLLDQFHPEQLFFHPHLSSIQLAFSRVRVPWQDAEVISAHGRSFEALTQALQQKAEKIAVLTDNVHSPAAIARLLITLDLAFDYQFWVCENLDGANERVAQWEVGRVENQTFSPLNVVILLRQFQQVITDEELAKLPGMGIPDRLFHSYSDRPGLMTKREVRLLILGELSLQPQQVLWDVGAGTGSVSIEVARLFPSSTIYAIEKTAAGTGLIEKNMKQFQVHNVVSIHGTAPEILHRLRSPNRIFIGGSGGNLNEVLGVCSLRLLPRGVMVMTFATVEHLNLALQWLQERIKLEPNWSYRLLQVQLSQSVPVGNLTRLSPLNPVTILTINCG